MLAASMPAPSAPQMIDSAEDLFAGLQFPDVPTAPVILQNNHSGGNSVSQSRSNNIVDDESNSISMVEIRSERMTPKVYSQVVPELPTLVTHRDMDVLEHPMPPPSVSKAVAPPAAVQTASAPATDYSKLYHTPVESYVASNLYPEVPSIREDDSYTESSSLLENTTSNSASAGGSGMLSSIGNFLGARKVIASASQYPAQQLAPDQAQQIQQLPQPSQVAYPTILNQPPPLTVANGSVPVQGATTQNQISTPADALVSELINENTRLTEEVKQLRFALQNVNNGQQQQAPLQLPPHPVVARLANTTYMQQQIANSVQPIVAAQTGLGVRQPPAVTVATAPNANGTSSTANAAMGVLTRNPAEIGASALQQPGMKYVCCGGCRQWLLAPANANLVHCAGCHCVNNCALHQPLTPQSTVAQRPAPRGWLAAMFGDCIRTGQF